MPATALACVPFPNTTVFYGARKVSRGPLAGSFRGWVRTVERSSWLTPCVNKWNSDVARPSRESAEEDARKAAEEAARTGYVPAF